MSAVAVALTFGCGEDNKAVEPSCKEGEAGCPPLPPPPPPKCETSAPTTCTQPDLTYTADIKPMVGELCLGCHKGEPDGPWSLGGYEHVANWHDLLRGAMLQCTMPPADSGLTMTTEQRQTMLEWLRCGFPE